MGKEKLIFIKHATKQQELDGLAQFTISIARQMEPKALNINPVINPSAHIVNYLRTKCSLSQDQIEKKLMNGETFDMMPEEGTETDTRMIEQILAENDFYEKEGQKMLKDEAMKFVSNIVEEWSMGIAEKQMRINQDEISQYSARLLPFGSHVLDLRSNSSDIDLVCVCPNFIKRETHFFQELAASIGNRSEIKHLATRTTAKVPIITFQYKQIEIDITFCQLSTESVPRDIEKVISFELLRAIKDEQSRISLLGRKNNLMIVELTGKQAQNFKQTLRLVKVWAKNRGISCNGMGYLGGISWAILVAKICQIFPRYKPVSLFYEFFAVYSIWNWKVPVRLTQQYSGRLDDKNMAPMTIVTPASEENSTARVNIITAKVLVSEIKRGAELLQAKRDIAEVCKKVDFFNSFPVFIEMDIVGSNTSKEGQKDYKDFQGFIQSKILRLLQIIQRLYKKEIEEGLFRIVPLPKAFKMNDREFPLCHSFFIGTELIGETQVGLAPAVKEWTQNMDLALMEKKNLHVRVFETSKEDIKRDVEIGEPKKQKEDPRLAIMRQKKKETK